MRRKSWILLSIVVLALGVVAGAMFSQRDANTRNQNALLAISLPDPDGKEQALVQWRGKVLVVNFWATWCAPCREEMPLFMAAQSRHAAQGLQFVGIAVDEPSKVRRFVNELQLNYPTLIGGYGALDLSKTLGNSLMALPFTVVISREGKIVQTQLGPMREAQLDDIARQLL